MRQPATQHKGIMIIDDNATEIFILKSLFRNSNLDLPVISFTNPLDAIRYFHDIINGDTSKTIPEVILLDINMPMMNGFRFLDQLMDMSTDLCSELNVNMLTSSEDVRDHRKAKNYPMINAYYSKPLNIQMFIEQMEKTRALH